MANLNIFAATGYNCSVSTLSLLILQNEVIGTRRIKETVIDFVGYLPSKKSIL